MSNNDQSARAAHGNLPEPEWFIACTKGYRSWDCFTDDPSDHPNYRPESVQRLYTADQLRAVVEKCAAICAEMEAGYKEVRDQIGEPVVGCVYSHLADGAQVCAAEIRERFGITSAEIASPVTGDAA